LAEAKRRANLKAHGLDFVDARLVFERVTFTFETLGSPTASSALSRWTCLPAFPSW
jgi:uncharacterized DUF497 family protein